MVKKSKLLLALDAHKGRDYEAEKQKAQRKNAEKRKKSKVAQATDESPGAEVADILLPDQANDKEWESEDDGIDAEALANGIATLLPAGSDISSNADLNSVDGEGIGEQAEEDNEVGEDSEDEEDGGDDEDDEDIPLSDIESLASEDREDIVPHQRLTINNTAALLKAYKSIALPPTLPFSAHQSHTSAEQVEIADVHDDLTRELAFYKQCLDAAVEARLLLKKEGVPFTRPNDYFAEMVKTDEHMGKIKSKMTEEAASKKAASEARKQRDLKKFGKQVQIAKLQERDKAKKDTLEKINILKRKRKDTDTGAATEESLFDVALDNEIKDSRGDRRKGSGPGIKRQKKDEKFGFGGKKRFAKSNDAASTGDLSGFSSRKMKGQAARGGRGRSSGGGRGGGRGGRTGSIRPGKSKRAKMS